ncbi:hypothetical protein EJ08DRAFT_342508 [Tothia fuscella]|uniref:Uncharacterized protein n=1 Tax=Tothia fuscella TaxID=1048955 RepID=A0A9P4U3E3_9PEZI|nr:hypothetical protein EJ08DRAFT_342508 [Tothia fuscella]
MEERMRTVAVYRRTDIPDRAQLHRPVQISVAVSKGRMRLDHRTLCGGEDGVYSCQQPQVHYAGNLLGSRCFRDSMSRVAQQSTTILAQRSSSVGRRQDVIQIAGRRKSLQVNYFRELHPFTGSKRPARGGWAALICPLHPTHTWRILKHTVLGILRLK